MQLCQNSDILYISWACVEALLWKDLAVNRMAVWSLNQIWHLNTYWVNRPMLCYYSIHTSH